MKPIRITQPNMPPLEEFLPYLESIWDSKQLTNGGPFHVQLEQKLAEYLGVPFISLFANGTIALITAIKALELKGEVITTPFSFVASSHSLLWNEISPVFVDISTDTFNLDAKLVEQAITENTTAIMPVHCYGQPCDTSALASLATKHGLSLLYDAAHAFGVENEGQSLLNYGELSVLSFHATKVFNTFEGGAIVSQSEAMKKKIDRLKNFGILSETSVAMVGINGKMSELHAAFGLMQLNHVEDNIVARKAVSHFYDDLIGPITGLAHSKFNADKHNYSYYPILVKPDYPVSRDHLYEIFKNRDIHLRRYFYPLISDLSMYRDIPSAAPANLPVATVTAKQVLCLPIYPTLEREILEEIAAILKDPLAEELKVTY